VFVTMRSAGDHNTRVAQPSSGWRTQAPWRTRSPSSLSSSATGAAVGRQGARGYLLVLGEVTKLKVDVGVSEVEKQAAKAKERA
jgi:hypothetical protein